MAKYRHRIFEMYEFLDEAAAAQALKATSPSADDSDPASWSFHYLHVSRSSGMTHIEFKQRQSFDEETVNDLREDFAQLAEKLVRSSTILLDFSEAESFCAAAIDALELFNQKLRVKGSRLALCCLAPEVRESFFPTTHRQQKN